MPKRKTIKLPTQATREANPAPPTPIAQLPRWVAKDHELWFGDVLVKRYHRPAPIASLILAAFEEQNWPPLIDDPLSPILGRHEPARLRNQVQSLKRRLTNPLIRFYLHSAGTQIGWKPAK